MSSEHEQASGPVNSEKLKNYVELVGLFGILASLIFVAKEDRGVSYSID